MREVTRLQIVVRARQGDADAFEALVHEHTPSVYRLARAIVGEGAARSPWVSVRRIVSSEIGPTAAAIANPSTRPRAKSPISMSLVSPGIGRGRQ